MPQSDFWEQLGSEKLDNRRRGGRIRQESIVCQLGPVLDLSAGGARVLSTTRVAGVIELTLRDEQASLPLQAEVMWCRRRGFFKREIGVRFVNLTEAQRSRIIQMTMHNAIARVFYDGKAA